MLNGDEHTKYGKLAHSNFERYNGEYLRAKSVYKDLLSAEGHRNYPLREAKCLRIHPDLMLPLGKNYFLTEFIQSV